MDIEKLLECSASELEAMSDLDLKNFFEPILQFTRPEKVLEELAKNPPKKIVGAKKEAVTIDKDRLDKLRKLAEQAGFDFEDLN